MKALLVFALIALPAFSQERTLQDVASERKLVPKAARVAGSFSATESSVPQDNAGWASLYAANAEEARIKREAARAELAALEARRPSGFIVQTYVVGGGGYVSRSYSAPHHSPAHHSAPAPRASASPRKRP